jgi:hypothetical protein
MDSYSSGGFRCAFHDRLRDKPTVKLSFFLLFEITPNRNVSSSELSSKAVFQSYSHQRALNLICQTIKHNQTDGRFQVPSSDITLNHHSYSSFRASAPHRLSRPPAWASLHLSNPRASNSHCSLCFARSLCETPTRTSNCRGHDTPLSAPSLCSLRLQISIVLSFVQLKP